MTETFFKAVQPNGTDFYSGTVRWLPPVGESLPPDGLIVTHPTVRKKSPGDACDYLSVATVPTACTGMRWPCRLARVERTRADVWTPDADLPHKRASWQWRVVEELDPTLALGPQGAEVAALIDRASLLTREEAKALDAAEVAAEVAAWVAVRGAQNAGRNAAWKDARVAARCAAEVAAWVAVRGAREAAWNATCDAALAMIVRDLIDDAAYQTLIGPWQKVIGEKA